MDTILVPVDGSAPSRRACKIAADLAKKYSSKIVLITIVPDTLAVNIDHKIDIISQNLAQGEKMLQNFTGEFKDVEGEVVTKCLVGDIAAEIIASANREGADLIVMGSRGMGAFSRTFLGSISNKVVNNTDTSVLIVK